MFIKHYRGNKGFTLIELMIAIVIGMLVIAAAIAIYVAAIKGSSHTLKNAKLTEQASFVMRLMSDDIRRAGYWGGAVAGANVQNNTFTSIYIPNTHNCILYSYDADGDALTTPNPEVNELYGFKLSNGIIQIKTGGDAASASDCSLGNWSNITDAAQVNVTDLWICDEGLKWRNATANNSGPTTAPDLTDTTCTAVDPSTSSPAASSGDLITEVRQIKIIISAISTSDSDITVRLQDTVEIRNNLIYTEP